MWHQQMSEIYCSFALVEGYKEPGLGARKVHMFLERETNIHTNAKMFSEKSLISEPICISKHYKRILKSLIILEICCHKIYTTNKDTGRSGISIAFLNFK